MIFIWKWYTMWNEEKIWYFLKGERKEVLARGSLEISVSICHQASKWGHWEGYKGEGVEGGGGRIDGA